MDTAPSSVNPGISHLVLTVRDIDASHAFYTKVLGFEQCGRLRTEIAPDVDMRFYRGHPSRHHDLALLQSPDPSSQPPVEPFAMFGARVGLNHLAIAYPTREAWLAKLAELQAGDVPVVLRGNHGMTHSCYVQDPDGHGIELLYDLPREVWEGDVDAALSYFEFVPPERFLEDETDYKVFGRAG